MTNQFAEPGSHGQSRMSNIRHRETCQDDLNPGTVGLLLASISRNTVNR